MAWPLAALLLLVIPLAALAGRRRARGRQTADSGARHSAPRPQTELPAIEPEPTPVKNCPVCLSEYPTRNRYCVRDGVELMDGPASGPFAQGMICPTCRRGYSCGRIGPLRALRSGQRHAAPFEARCQQDLPRMWDSSRCGAPILRSGRDSARRGELNDPRISRNEGPRTRTGCSWTSCSARDRTAMIAVTKGNLRTGARRLVSGRR